VEEFFSEGDLKKMKCIIDDCHINKKHNHFNCFEYKDWPLPYHELRKAGKNSINIKKTNSSQSDNQFTNDRYNSYLQSRLED